MGIRFRTKGIDFEYKHGGCTAFYYDLFHHPLNKTRGVRLFFHQLFSGTRLVLLNKIKAQSE